MTATQARQRLGTILSRVLQGEDIGIVHSRSGKIIALRPVEVYSEDYALIEYGLTEKELKGAIHNINKPARHEAGSGGPDVAAIPSWRKRTNGPSRRCSLRLQFCIQNQAPAFFDFQLSDLALIAEPAGSVLVRPKNYRS